VVDVPSAQTVARGFAMPHSPRVHDGRLIAHFEFLSGVEEVFDVQILPGVRHPYLAGPFAPMDGRSPIWVVPRPGD
jgi:hypothetical protein